jgi:tetratricopeptide (TPR) repeat protein
MTLPPPSRPVLRLCLAASLSLAALVVSTALAQDIAPPESATTVEAVVAGEPTTETGVEGTPAPGRPPGLDSAFDHAPDFGGIRDFLLNAKEPSGPDASEWRQRIDMARQQRESGNYNFAFANLQQVLDSKADESLRKTALMEMATTQYRAGQIHEALKTYAMFRSRYPQDAGVPQVIFYQGLLLRELGAPDAALSRFHTVLSAALNLNLDEYEYYRRLVLLAQGQIADTLYAQGKLEEAADKYAVLLRDDSTLLNQSMIRYRLILCLDGLGKHGDLVAQAKSYLESDPESGESPHVRHLLSTALKHLGRNAESLAEVKALLESAAAQDSPGWKAWQQRTGNEIANRLYQEGDYFNALTLYLKLAELEASPAWRLPVWYQIGLIHERLEAPAEAVKTYRLILDQETELAETNGPALKTLVDMARWRHDFIQWKFEAEKARIQLQQASLTPARNVSTNQ